ncbi:hypothetical protein [Pseudomonas sp. PDM25]|uniref:hypothetical protein n=1 Tax=Pseudomonas sp. PDM25 TaxID=2854772 RepID=UPI001C441D82|nr:hypothetical protein [Pseudomonas sp. PDM25]MBV7515708.1 hypothetical protein [Pseudomonas sp. PDM25]
MSVNRFYAGATLQVIPDTVDNTYAFYLWQVVTFTATLTLPGGVADGQVVIFQSVGSNGKFEIYGSHNSDTTFNEENLAWQVVARSKDADRSVATATIRALYSSTASKADTPDIFSANAPSVMLQSSDAYTVVAPSVSMFENFDPYHLLPASSVKETPLSSGGNYFICSVYVSDPNTGSGLKNICLRLSTQADHSFSGVAFYPALSSTAVDALTIHQDSIRHWVDLLTDEDGVANVYVCASKTSGTYAGIIHGKCGVVEDIIAMFVIPDFKSDADPRLGAPLLTSPEVQVPAAGIDTIACVIPAYLSNATNDWLFVLCNKRVQNGEGSNFPRKVTGQVLASFSKFGLHNETFDDDNFNELTYIVLPAREPAALASRLEFYVDGDPGAPIASLHDGKMKAPAIVETLGHEVIINASTISHGLNIRVPVGKANTDVLWDDVRYAVIVTIDVSGWMAGFDDPMAVRITSPKGREISKVDLVRGYVDIWFGRIELWGFGQSVKGVMGRCDVQYKLYSIIPGRSASSQILHCHIDTLPPSGLGPYFD